MPNVAGTITIGGNLDPLIQDINRVVNKRYNLNFSNNSSFSLGQISRDANDFSKSLKAAEARVLAFGATTGIIIGVSSAFKKLVESAVSVEKSLTDINTVLNLSNSNLSRFGSDLFEIAKKTGQSFSDVADTAKEFSRQGLGVEATLTRTSDAMVLARLSGLNLSEALSSITSSLNSFDKSFLNSTEVINKLIAVDRSFAVSSADLAESLTRVGSTAQDAGVSLDELLGIVTAVQQTTSRGGAVIGNALKSIFTRISRNDTIQQLQDLGVAIDKNQNGLEKLKAISDAVKLNPSFSNQIKELAGGVYQINVVSAALQDLGKEYNIVGQATKIAANATNEAITANASLNKTLAAISNEALQNITELSAKLGQDLFGPTARNILGSINSIADGLKNISNSSDDSLSSVGLKFGEGIIKGIGNYISGPGLALVGTALGKIAVNFASFAKNSVEGLLSINSASKQQELLTRSVNDILSDRKNIINQVYNGTKSVAQAEIEVLNILRQQSVEKEKQLALAKVVSAQIVGTKNTVVLSSFSPAQNSSPQGFKYKADGFIPSSSAVSSINNAIETNMAKAAGYNPGEVRQMRIPNYGNVIFNSREKVVDFGLGQPAILPPQGTLAANNYQKEFTSLHGFNPYAAFGMIPNFVKKLGRGAFGTFYDLEKTVGGFPIGKKLFNTNNSVPNSGIAQEFDISKTLRELSDSGKINPLFGFPAVFGTLERSIKAQRIGKEVIQGKVLSNSDIDRGLTQPFRESLADELSPFGINAEDLHSGNFIANQKFIDIFKKIEQSGNGENQYNLLAKITRGKNRKRNISRISSAIARQGGKLSLVDSGEFTKTGADYLKYNGNNNFTLDLIDAQSVEANLDVLKAFLQERGVAFASGYVPNYAQITGKGISNSLIKECLGNKYELGKSFSSFYKDYRKGLSETGLPQKEIDLFNRIYSSISYGAEDKLVLNSSKDILLKKLQIGSTSANDYREYLQPLGNIQGRVQALNKALNGIPLGQDDKSKTRIYLDALSGNDDAIAIDRNFIGTALNRRIPQGDKITNDFRDRLDANARELASSLGISGSELQAAVFAGQRSTLKGKRGITSFEPFSNVFASLKEAVLRERTAGISPNLIHVGQSEQLINSQNPFGLGVYNSKDEPLGLQQGINRAVSFGQSPKFSASGHIPNYALPLESIRFSTSPGVGMESITNKQQEVVDLIEKFKDEIKGTFGAQKEATNFARQLGVDYKLTDETVKKIQSSLKSSIQYYDKQKEQAKQRVEDLKSLGVRQKTSSDQGVFNQNLGGSIINPNFLTERLATKSPDIIIEGFLEKYINSGGPISKLPRIPAEVKPTQSVVPAQGSLYGDFNTSNIFQFPRIPYSVATNGKNAVPLGLAAGVESVETQSKYNKNNPFGIPFVTGTPASSQPSFNIPFITGTPIPPKPSLNINYGNQLNGRPSMEEVLANDILRSEYPLRNQGRPNWGINGLPYPNRSRFFLTEYQRPTDGPMDREVFNDGLYGFNSRSVRYKGVGNAKYDDFSVFSGGSDVAKQIKSEIESNLLISQQSSQKKSLSQRIINSKLGSSAANLFSDSRGYFLGLGAEALSGGVQELIGTQSLERRRAGSVVGAFGSTLSAASTGGLIGSFAGPGGSLAGAGVGALVGLTTGVYSALKGWNDVLPDIENKLSLLRESTSKASDGLSRYISSTQKLQDVFSGEVSVTPNQLKKLKEEQSFSLLQLGLTSEEKKSISSSKDNIQAVNDIFEKAIFRKLDEVKSLEIDKFVNTDLSKITSKSSILYKPENLPLSAPVKIERRKLTPEGSAEANKFFENILLQKNAKGETLSSIFEKNPEFISSLSNKFSGPFTNDKGFFESISKFAKENNFNEGFVKQLTDLSAKFSTVQDSALSPLGLSLIKQIPENKQLLEDINNIKKQSVIQQKQPDNLLINTLLDFNKEIQNQVIKNNKDNLNIDFLKNSRVLERDAALQISGLTDNDLINNLKNLNNEFLNIQYASEAASNSLKNNLGLSLSKLSFQAAESIATKNIDNLQNNKDINPQLREKRISELTSVVSEFRDLSRNNNISPEELKKTQTERINIINNALFNSDLSGDIRKSLEAELEERRKFVENIDKVVTEYTIDVERINSTFKSDNFSAKLNASTKESILNFRTRSAIGGSLLSFGQSPELSKSIFNLNQEVQAGKFSGNTDTQVRGLANIASIYNNQGLRIPDNVRNDLIESITKSITEQVNRGLLVLPKNVTAEQVAQDKFASEFRNNSSFASGNLRSSPYVIKDVSSDVENQIELFSNVNEQLNLSTSIKARIITLNDKILKQTIDGLQAQREFNSELRKQLSSQGEDAFKQGRITGDQFRQLQLQRRAAEKDLNGGRLTGNSLRDSFFDQFRYNTRDLYDDLEKGAAEVGQQLKTGFKDAFKSFADGTKSAEDALADFGISILKKLGDTAFDVAINSVFNVIGGSVGSYFGYKGGKSKGGIITPQKYSTGGQVSGGSGVKDDVPALLTEGEYVIKKSAAARYGIDFLDSINNLSAIYDGSKNSVKVDENGNTINAVFKNAFAYDNEKRPTKGNLNIDPSLSTFALEDSNNPLNQLRQSREQALGDYLRDVKDYEDYKKQQIEAFRTQRRRAGQAALVQAGISLAGLGISTYASSVAPKTAGVTTAVTGATGNTVVSQQYNTGIGYNKFTTTGGIKTLDSAQYNAFNSNPQAFGFSSSANLRYINYGSNSYSPSAFGGGYSYGVGYGRMMGGMIQRYASGGGVKFGGNSSSDKVPALLMGGEYVMRANTVRSYGKDFFDKLNNGSINKMASGGYVGSDISSGKTNLDQTVDNAKADISELINALTEIKNILSAKTTSTSGDTNVSIAINIDKSGNTSESTNVSSSGDKDNKSAAEKRKDYDDARKLAERIKPLVLQVISEQKRPGGSLENVR